MKKIFIIISILFALILLSIYPSYLISKKIFDNYFNKWGDKLVALDKKGLLSKQIGAAWQDIIESDKMSKHVEVTSGTNDTLKDSLRIVDGVIIDGFPSLSIVKRLNEIAQYENSIKIKDRNGYLIANIKTEHTRADIKEFPKTMIKALIAAEDGGFYKNGLGFEYDSFVRAIIRAIFTSIKNFSISSPKGTSTITQQVAKLFLSYLDEDGYRRVSNSVGRKVKELKLAAALRKIYTPNEILEVYLNHCVASSYGLVGVKDIAKGLFGCELSQLTDAQSIYLARMVKWGANVPEKIKRQCHIDMSRIAPALGISDGEVKDLLYEIDSLSFVKPKQISTEHGYLVDIANEYWLQYLRNANKDNGVSKENMDLIDPSSLIRRKGNLEISLTIDLNLQKFLEVQVNKRGFGNDTIIRTDARIGSFGENIKLDYRPSDTLRLITIIDSSRVFSEPNKKLSTTLQSGDTLVTNIRYKKIRRGEYRRSCFYYVREKIMVGGQYYAYVIIDSKSGELLAYYSRDKIGSRISSLMKNRTPNGSSTAKPIFNALNYDLGKFKPYDKWIDSVAVEDDVPWRRSLVRKNGKPWDVEFANTAVRNRVYRVHNHGHSFEGNGYIFDHLATSNNIFGVESVYRLNTIMFDNGGNVISDAWPSAQFFYRLNALDRIKKIVKTKPVTGIRFYKELARVVGADVDSMLSYGTVQPVSDSMYSIALGTLELTLYQQVHLFNMLYNNSLIENPQKHISLAVKQITLNGTDLKVASRDTVKKYHPLSNWNSIRPTLLGLHKRLVSNRWDGLSDFDISYQNNDSIVDTTDANNSWDEYKFYSDVPLANYAKSGTTDDVLRPYNVDITSKKRTNYGLWNAVLRVDLAKLDKVLTTDSSNVRDITIACVGECGSSTGPRDGKTLHKFITTALLKKAGIKNKSIGYFKEYEKYLISVTPDSINLFGEEVVVDSLITDTFLVDSVKY